MARASPVVVTLALLSGCASLPERMSYRTVYSPAMGRPMQYGVWAPRALRADEALPLFVFLHGGGDDVHCLDAHGISAHLDAELEAGRIRPIVVLVPQGDRGFWTDWADGSEHYESWVLNEAVPLVAREYGTASTHLIGISMGGNGALRFALAHQGAFRSAAVLSAPTLDAKGMDRLMGSWFPRTFWRVGRVFGDPYDEERKRRADPFQQWRKPEDLAGLRLFLAHGNHDRGGLAETNASLHAHLERARIPHRYLVFHGGHRWRDWKPLFGEVIRDGLEPRY